MCVRRPRFLAVHGIRLAPPMFSDQITMRTTRDAGGPRARAGWWRTLGFLGAALVLPGGLVLLLYLIARPGLLAGPGPRPLWRVGTPTPAGWRARARAEPH